MYVKQGVYKGGRHLGQNPLRDKPTSCDHVTQVSIAKSCCELPSWELGNRAIQPHLPTPACYLISLLRFQAAGQGPGAISRRMGTLGTGFFFPHGPKRNDAQCSGVLATSND